jgi:hypothetical protein
MSSGIKQFMKAETNQNDSQTLESLKKVRKGGHKKYPSFGMGDKDFEGILKCTVCSSQRVQIISRSSGRKIRCSGCGNEKWN